MLSFLLFVSACANPEVVNDGDVQLKLVIPKEAATRTVVSATDDDGDGIYSYTSSELTDVRLLGPVYVGAFGGIDDISFPYAHPKMGPIVSGGLGDTYPYGGETVGRLDFACYEFLSCKVSTGRFADYQDILDHFRNNLGTPVVDAYGNEVINGETMRAWCYDYFSATADDEMSFIGEDNLSFTEDGDNFVADVTLHHTNRVDGLSLWGFMDAPEIETDEVSINGAYTTCNASYGRQVDEYNSGFFEGSSSFDILNKPSTYIQYGDWVSDGAATVSFDEELNQLEVPEVNLNFHYQAEE